MDISAKDVMALRKKTGAGMMDCKKALKETEGDLDAAVKFLREKGMASAAKRAGRDAKEGRVAVVINDDKTEAAIIEINSETDFVARNEEFTKLMDRYSNDALTMGAKAVNNLIPVEAFDLEELTGLAGRIGENLTFRRAGYIKAENGLVDSYMHPGDQLGVLIVLSGDADAVKSNEALELAHDLTLQIAAASPIFVRSEDVPADLIEKEKEIYRTQMLNEGKPANIVDRIAEGKINKYFEDVCLLNQINVKEAKQKISDRVAEAAKAAGGALKVDSFIRFKVGEGA